MEPIIILGEITVWESAQTKQVKRYIKGRHPHLGTLHIGLSGDWETVIETTIIKAMRIISVIQ